ncbi:MAG: RNA polymerase sigma factor [Roseibacillus sp.]
MSNSPSQKVMLISGHPEGAPLPEKPAMREVFEQEEEGLLRFAFGLLGRREVAEEIVQEGFLALFENYEEVQNPRAWLYRAIRNKAFNEIRKRKREVIDERAAEGKDDEREAPDEVLGRMEAAGQLQLLMAELAPRDGELVRMKYFEGLDYKEIAARSKMTVGNVGYRLHHVLKGLADGLRRVGVEGRLG